ncbi:MAG: hypothetical protein WKI04_04655 [Ferruginibacter sp.]
MKRLTTISVLIIQVILYTLLANKLAAQANCILQPPMLRVDFGGNGTPVDPNLSEPENYERIFGECPQDGHYSIVSSTSDCFRGHWVTLNQDHTSGDMTGNMMVVNAAYQPGVFFVTELIGLKPNTIYQLGVWLLNICKPEYECTSIRPNLRFIIENTDGIEVAKFSTGYLTPTGEPDWLQYSARFTTPAKGGNLVLKVSNKADGGCGNDFAMDDITVSECLMPKPVRKETSKSQQVLKPVPPVVKNVSKPKPPAVTPLKKVIPVITKTLLRDSVAPAKPGAKERAVISLPRPLLYRANPIVKQIETVNSEVVIDLYDNGEIDGDTVSIYHNNLLVVSKAGLSATPVTIRFNVDAMHPHHELVMVANNLGSIPPNTSLMIVTVRDKRYEVFISSSEQKNAKVVIDLKSP